MTIPGIGQVLGGGGTGEAGDADAQKMQKISKGTDIAEKGSKDSKKITNKVVEKQQEATVDAAKSLDTGDIAKDAAKVKGGDKPPSTSAAATVDKSNKQAL